MQNLELWSFLKSYFKEIIGILTAIFMFFLGKRKREQNTKLTEVEITGNELYNVETALKIYKVMLDDLQIKLTEAQRAYGLLTEKFKEALDTKNACEKELARLRGELKQFKDGNIN